MGVDESEVAISRGASGQKFLAISYSRIIYAWISVTIFFSS